MNIRLCGIFLSVMILLSASCGDDIRPDMYFIGDSIIARWDLDECFPSYNTYNLGIGGSGVCYIESLAGKEKGREVMILSGTNDLNVIRDNDIKIDSYAQRYVSAIEELEASHVYLYSILPREFDGDGNLLPTIIKLNARIKAISSHNPEITYINVYDDFMIDGHLDYELYSDYLHLSDAGYAILSYHLLKNI